jgi:hypothetical protein
MRLKVFLDSEPFLAILTSGFLLEFTITAISVWKIKIQKICHGGRGLARMGRQENC